MKTKNRRGSDQTPSQDVLGPIQDIIRQVREGKLTGNQLQAFAEHRNPFPKKEEVAAGNGFSVTVNYDLLVESLVAQGKYDWKDSDINSKHFQTTRNGEATLNLELVHLNQVFTSEETLKELDKRGLRPAELHELLSFGVQYPEEQRKYPIVALGSVWQSWGGGRRVACLWVDGGRRRLSLDWFDDGWRGYCRFAAVSK